jgi:very-short-patch-repair endonuclease
MSQLEDILLHQMQLVGLPTPEREYRFAPPRRYRADFAYPDKKILVEVQGGIYTRGAHSRGTGLERDYEKINLAQLLGYKVFQFSRKMIESGEAISILENALYRRDDKRWICD